MASVVGSRLLGTHTPGSKKLSIANLSSSWLNGGSAKNTDWGFDSYPKKTSFCQTFVKLRFKVQTSVLGLGVDFVLPLSQQEEPNRPKQIYRFNSQGQNL